MSSPTPITLDAYLEGIQALFERGRYRPALEAISQALNSYPDTNSLLLWQAIATNAMGNTDEAIAIVQPLTDSGDRQTRQQAAYLIQIWSAPKLQRQREWQPTMPDFGQSDRSSSTAGGTAAGTTYATAPPAKASPQESSPSPASSIGFWPATVTIGLLAMAASTLLILVAH